MSGWIQDVSEDRFHAIEHSIDAKEFNRTGPTGQRIARPQFRVVAQPRETRAQGARRPWFDQYASDTVVDGFADRANRR